MTENDDIEVKQKELEGVVNPMMRKVCQVAGGGGDVSGGRPGGGVDDVPGAGGSAPCVTGWSDDSGIGQRDGHDAVLLGEVT